MCHEIRLEIEAEETHILSPYACLAAASRGRERPEEESGVRTCFQRDVDRITHSKSFRRLKHKTQVFLDPEGDHYRTRMTHTLEVTRIARTIARGLRLNEDLTEAIGLGHDLGHTPFGHAGERALNRLLPGGFTHNAQSLRVVDKLEKDGRGLNLTYEVRDGILCHTGPQLPATSEGQIIRLADRVAYINHDIDDAIRGGIIRETDIPANLTALLGNSPSRRINTLTVDIIFSSRDSGTICQTPQLAQAMEELRQFLFDRVYRNPTAKGEESKVEAMLAQMFHYYCSHPDDLPEEYCRIREAEGAQRAACDYIAGMTDSYAVARYAELYIPHGWTIK